jgi:hypothetical protein
LGFGFFLVTFLIIFRLVGVVFVTVVFSLLGSKIFPVFFVSDLGHDLEVVLLRAQDLAVFWKHSKDCETEIDDLLSVLFGRGKVRQCFESLQLLSVAGDVRSFSRLVLSVDLGNFCVDNRLVCHFFLFALEAELLNLVVSDTLPVLGSNERGIFA